MSSSHFPDTVLMANEEVRVLTLWEDGIKNKGKMALKTKPPAGHRLCLAVDEMKDPCK